MLQIDHILCPVDFSAPARRALDYAVGIARWYGARITALHVCPIEVPIGRITPLTAGTAVSPSGMSAEAWGRMLADFVGAERAEGVVIATEVVEGPVWQEIAAQARLQAADLVVLGTHGRSGFQRLLLGSVTERLLREVDCPVLTVPPGAPEAVPIAAGVFKSILCPTDFSPASDQAVRWGLALAQEADAEFNVLHVFEHAPEVDHETFPRSRLADYRHDYKAWAAARLHEAVPESARSWCTVREFIRAGSAHREITAAASEEGCDLIVMGIGKSRDMTDRVFGSTTQQVVRSATCPVLTVCGV
jgi:nucleotide-binding universal stress UspA family protein